MKKLLITGTAGFIGSHLVEYILSHTDDIHITSLDKLDYAGHIINLEHIPGGVESERHRFIKGSICDCKLVDELLSNGFDGLINVAAQTHVDRAFYHPEFFIENNVAGVLNLLRAVENYKVRRYLQISTDEVYGAAPPDKPCGEGAPLRPGNYYASSKAAADMYVLAAVNSKDINASIIRGTNNFGPRQYPEKLIPFFTRRILSGKTMPLYGDGQQMRDWLYVKDFCRAIWIVFNKGEKEQIYNAGAGNHTRNLELSKRMLSILGADESLINHVADRPGHDFCYSVKWDKLSKLGWAPKADFDTALEETVNWYCDNDKWVKIILTKSQDHPVENKFFENHYKNHS
ncbi:MAG: dTDP-glucose 4,6-dehydratase [candidate division Zixibacteria bacterium]